MSQEAPEFTIDDIPMVAWLKTRGFKPNGIRQRGESFFVWVFPDTSQLHDEVDTFLSEEALVEPRGYAVMLRETYRELPSSQGRSRRSRTA